MNRRTLPIAIAILLFHTQALAQMPFLQPGFVENIGQLHYPDGTPAADVLYKWSGPDFNMLFMRDRFVYEIQYVEKEAMEVYRKSMQNNMPASLPCGSQRIEYVFGGGNAARIVPQDGVPGKTSYPGGDGKGSYRPTIYGKLVYQNAFPNVDVEFHPSEDGHCEYDIVLREDAKLSDVSFDLNGTDPQELNAQGAEVKAEFAFGTFTERIPEAYAKWGAQKQSRSVQYERGANGQLTFACDASMERVPVGEQFVIDPVGALNWGTYFSPPNGNLLTRVVGQPGQIVYAAGAFAGAASTLITTGAPYSDLGDIWVAKFQDADGVLQLGDLLWSKLEGGIHPDGVSDMAVCGDRIAICGTTSSASGISTDATLLNDGLDPDNSDGFLIYLNANNGL